MINWIDVNDRLPERDELDDVGCCLTWVADSSKGHASIAPYSPMRKQFGIFDGGEPTELTARVWSGVTHWAPINPPGEIVLPDVPETMEVGNDE